MNTVPYSKTISNIYFPPLCGINWALDGSCLAAGSLQGASAGGGTHFVANSIGGADVDASLVQTYVRTVTAAELKALKTTPIEILPATLAGTGHSLLVHSVLFRFNWATTQYTGGGAIKLYYNGGDGSNVMASTVAASFVTGPTAAVTTDALVNGTASQLAVPQNTAVKMTCATADFADGDSTVVLVVNYRVV